MRITCNLDGSSPPLGFSAPQLFQDTSWLELKWLFVWSTNCSGPVLVEAKHATRGETTDLMLVEPTIVRIFKTRIGGEMSKRICSICQSQNHRFDHKAGCSSHPV